eukprot:362417-Chlamydomonas_euryale.AAC.4
MGRGISLYQPDVIIHLCQCPTMWKKAAAEDPVEPPQQLATPMFSSPRRVRCTEIRHGLTISFGLFWIVPLHIFHCLLRFKGHTQLGPLPVTLTITLTLTLTLTITITFTITPNLPLDAVIRLPLSIKWSQAKFARQPDMDGSQP